MGLNFRMWGGTVWLLFSLAVSLAVEDCTHGVCFQAKKSFKLKNPTEDQSALPHSLTCQAQVDTKDLIAACLPGIKPKFVANSFQGCGSGLKKVCKHAKRGWLMNTSDKQTVPNEEYLLASLKGLEGAEEAVKKCLKVEEEYDYYYYDYAYYDEYDYLEELDGAVGRVKRSPGGKNEAKGKGSGGVGKGNGKGKPEKGNNKGNPKKRNNKRKPKKRNNQGKPKKGKEGKNKEQGKGGKQKKRSNNGKQKKINNKRKPKKRNNQGKPKKDKEGKDKGKGKGGNKKETNETSEKGKGARIYTNKNPKNDAAKKANDAKIKKSLEKLGLASLPSKSSLDKLDCIYKEVSSLLVKCGKAKLERP